MTDEFSLISTYFAPLAAGFSGADGLRDDAALLAPPAGKEVVLTTDTLHEGIHFIGQEPAGILARKALRVNLSDLAAKGADPWCYFLNLGLPAHLGEAWVADFAAGLAADQQEFGLSLAGGDTTNTQTGISLTVTALGLVAAGTMVRRSGARVGDLLYVTGTIGDGVLGLRAAQGSLAGLNEEEQGWLRMRYDLPQPRVAFGRELARVASAAMHVSDGLAQDLGHLCRASGCGAEVRVGEVPYSAPAAAWINSACGTIEDLLSGGDDYELLFTVPQERCAEAERLAHHHETRITRIGVMTEAQEVVLRLPSGAPLVLTKTGFRHQWGHL